MPAIAAEQLTKHFSPAIRAVDGIDLAIDEGRIFGFLGANGSGKTTTVRMLTTLLRPTSGRARVGGLDVTRDATQLRRRIGVALQEAASTTCRRAASCSNCRRGCTDCRAAK
jgi:ABC-2 type transport system ATP-binding protein